MQGRLRAPYGTWKRFALTAALLALPGMLAACSIPLGPALATSLATAGAQTAASGGAKQPQQAASPSPSESAPSPQPAPQPTPQPAPEPGPQPAPQPRPVPRPRPQPDSRSQSEPRSPSQPGPQPGAAAQDLSALQSDLEAYLSRQDGTYGVFVVDLASGREAGFSPDTVFPAASTIKLPMAIYILNLASRGQISLDEKLAYRDADYEEGTGILQGDISPGDTFSVRRLLELAITQSDNIATNMLLHRFGRNNVFAYMQKLGGKVTQFNSYTNGTTPREMALYMQAAQTKTAIPDPSLRQWLMDSMEHTAFTDRIAAGVPAGVPVAHKIGTLPGVVNDIGMVFAPRRTFVVSVFSMDVDEEVAPAVIAEVTRRVYEFESRLAKPNPAR